MNGSPANADPRFSPLELLRTLRPHQWLKNAFVLVPLVFARHLFSLADLGRALGAFGLFCLVAGSVYVVNDVLDLDEDRAHPTKRHRPLAAGRLGVRDALLAMGVLLALALLGMAALDEGAAALTAGYFLLNVAYSRVLKNVPYVDVGTIAAGFLIRVMVGGLVIAVPVTAWLLACTFLVAVFLGLGKRKHELSLLKATGESKRRVLAYYHPVALTVGLWASGTVTAAAYLAYSLDPATVAKFGTSALVWTTPFVVAGLARFGRLMSRRDTPVSPTDAMLRDPLFVANLLALAVVVVVVLYGLGGRSPTPAPRPAPPAAAAPSAPAAKVGEPARQTIMLRVRSVPYGAEVSLDGERLGVTPLEVPVKASDQPRHLSLFLAGYEVRQMDLALTQDVGLGLNLKKLPPPGGGGPR